MESWKGWVKGKVKLWSTILDRLRTISKSQNSTLLHLENTDISNRTKPWWINPNVKTAYNNHNVQIVLLMSIFKDRSLTPKLAGFVNKISKMKRKRLNVENVTNLFVQSAQKKHTSATNFSPAPRVWCEWPLDRLLLCLYAGDIISLVHEPIQRDSTLLSFCMLRV